MATSRHRSCTTSCPKLKAKRVDMTAMRSTQSALGDALRHRLAALVGMFAVIFIVMSVVTDTFLTNANLSSVAVGAAIDLVLVAGQVIVIIAGGFDLSI